MILSSHCASGRFACYFSSTRVYCTRSACCPHNNPTWMVWSNCLTSRNAGINQGQQSYTRRVNEFHLRRYSAKRLLLNQTDSQMEHAVLRRAARTCTAGMGGCAHANRASCTTQVWVPRVFPTRLCKAGGWHAAFSVSVTRSR